MWQACVTCGVLQSRGAASRAFTAGMLCRWGELRSWDEGTR